MPDPLPDPNAAAIRGDARRNPSIKHSLTAVRELGVNYWRSIVTSIKLKRLEEPNTSQGQFIDHLRKESDEDKVAIWQGQISTQSSRQVFTHVAGVPLKLVDDPANLGVYGAPPFDEGLPSFSCLYLLAMFKNPPYQRLEPVRKNNLMEVYRLSLFISGLDPTVAYNHFINGVKIINSVPEQVTLTYEKEAGGSVKLFSDASAFFSSRDWDDDLNPVLLELGGSKIIYSATKNFECIYGHSSVNDILFTVISLPLNR